MSLNPKTIFGVSPVGGIFPYGDSLTTFEMARGSPLGHARLGVRTGTLQSRNDGKFYDPTSGVEVPPAEVWSRYEARLRGTAGPSWLEGRPVPVLDPDKKPTGGTKIEDPVWWGGVLPEGMRDVRKFLGLDKGSVKGTVFESSWPMVQRGSQNADYLLAALADAIVRGGINLRELRRKNPGLLVGSAIGQGMPGLNDFTDLSDSAGAGKNNRNLYAIANLLQGGASGVMESAMGPHLGGEIDPDDSAAIRRLQTWGPNHAGSGECASILYVLAVAMSELRTDPEVSMMIVGAAEAPHGTPLNRPGHVGFRTLRATEDKASLIKRGGDKDLWGAYIPFLKDTGGREGAGFWMGEGAVATFLMSVDFAVRNNIPLDALIAGYAIRGDHGGKANVAQLGPGIIKAGLRAFERTREIGIYPEQVGYFSAHGTGTPQTNQLEPTYLYAVLKALKALPTKDRRIKMSAWKAFLTHLLSVAAGVELAMVTQGMQANWLPGLFNKTEGRGYAIDPKYLEYFDPDFTPRTDPIEAALFFSEGFWGRNGALIIAAVTEEILRKMGYGSETISEYMAATAVARRAAAQTDLLLLAGGMTYTQVLVEAAFG